MCFFFFKQKTAYELRISDWSSGVCSSDLDRFHQRALAGTTRTPEQRVIGRQSLGETPRVVEQDSALLGNTLQQFQIETVDGFDRRQPLSFGMPDKSIDCRQKIGRAHV